MAICIVHKSEFDADKEPGANLYGPPHSRGVGNIVWEVDKQHICRECYAKVIVWIRTQVPTDVG